MNIKLPTEHHLEFLSVKGGYTGSSASTHVKIPHCWKSHVVAQLLSCNAYSRAHQARQAHGFLIRQFSKPAYSLGPLSALQQNAV